MGNILSNDGKLSPEQKRELFTRQNAHKLNWLNQKYRHHYGDRLTNRSHFYKYKKKKADFLRSKNENNRSLGTRSQSLNAIIDDLYWCEAYDIIENKLTEIKFDANKPLIPRIKLRSFSAIKEEGRYKQLFKMSSEPELLTSVDSTNSSTNHLNKTDDCFQSDNRLLNRLTILINDQKYDEIQNKPEDNYFSKNFDESIKRLQQIEKEHEMIENDDSDIQIYLRDKNAETPEPTEDETDFRKQNDNTLVESKNFENGLSSDNRERIPVESNESAQNGEEKICSNKLTDNITIANRNAENEDLNGNENHERISEWYSNLKERFEKTEQENDRPSHEMSCRITGAILKSTNECPKQEEKEKDTRHYFSKLVKSNKSLIDEELPDPDKVKNIRAMFQENLNSTLKKRLDKKLGGSLQNIHTRTAEQQMMRPLSAQCCRNDEAREDQKFKNISETDISGTVKDNGRECTTDRKKLFEKYEKDSKLGRDLRSRKFLQPKWTDTGSLSSGVGSDLSSYDTDVESFSREGTEQDEIVVSDDDLLEEVNDKHYVQNEVLERIRSFGTSVTYYGGEMITCSVGPLLSPTTQAIMEEISEKYGREAAGTRSFEEFYRKYVETNEPNRKKKVGRARSFGQYDVFQKPNVLRNSEIDMFKNDLEIEIGIKKPLGISQNSLKRRAAKSESLEGGATGNEDKNKICQESALESEANSLEDKNAIADKEVSLESESTKGVECGDVSSKESVDAEKNQVESAATEEEETATHVIKETKNEAFYKRAQSAPEGTLADEKQKKFEASHKPTEEILFGYEKSLINGKAQPDMEFEEFEVCESVEEKLEKLEEKNLTETKQTPATNGIADDENCGESINADNKRSESFSNLEKRERENEILAVKLNRQVSAPERFEKYKSEKFSKYNYSKWPIETTVMVDIQKTSEQTPKIIKNEKTVAKTKLRLF